MSFSLLHKRIPTLLGLFLLVIGVGVTSFLVQQGVIFFGHAAPTDTPQNIRITNISDSSFTVTYTTDAAVIGTISLQEGDNSQTILDERDQTAGTPKAYTVHSITAKNLQPNTSYSFSILSGATIYLDNDKPFSITTASPLSQNPSTTTPLAGKIILPDGTTPAEALIFATTDNGQLLSTLLNPSGLYILPLNNMRTKELSQPLTLTNKTRLQLLVISANQTSHILVQLDGSNPVPPITLSQDYDFTVSENPVSSSSAKISFPSFSIGAGSSATPKIITPKTDEKFSDQKPQFSGTASPNSTVSITIHSETAISAKTTTDSNGNWTYRPTTPLAPGQHTITITAPDASGILHTIEQSFTVYAAGSQVSQSATPSATLAPTKAPTATPRVVTPTLTTTVQITPTAPPSQTTKGGIVHTTPKPTLPPTGSNTVAVVSIAGITTALLGIALFLVTSGAVL